MRCHICDKALTEAEILVNPHGFEPCTTCLEIALDAAYCGGFVREEPLDDPELNDEFGDGAVETLDTDTFQSAFDFGDTGFQEGRSYE